MPTDIQAGAGDRGALQEPGATKASCTTCREMVSLLVEPWHLWSNARAGSGMRAICQLAFSRRFDHVQMIVVSSDLDQWDWVKWLPLFFVTRGGTTRQMLPCGWSTPQFRELPQNRQVMRGSSRLDTRVRRRPDPAP